MSFGARITQTRKQKGWTQTELAEKAQTSRDLIGKYERDDIMPGADVAARIADALETSLDYLLRNIVPGINKEYAELFAKLEVLSASDLDHVSAVINAFATKTKLESIKK